jgi:hypothetical protein
MVDDAFRIRRRPTYLAAAWCILSIATTRQGAAALSVSRSENSSLWGINETEEFHVVVVDDPFALHGPSRFEGSRQNAGSRQNGDTTLVAGGSGLWALLVSVAAVLATWLGQYEDAMIRYPIVVKCVSSSLVGMIGDCVAQGFERATCDGGGGDGSGNGSSDGSSDGSSSSSSSSSSDGSGRGEGANEEEGREKLRRLRQRHDWRRMVSVGISEGIAGPLLHVCYAGLEAGFPTWPRNTTTRPVAHSVVHMAVDTFLLDPVFIANAFVCSGLLEGKALAAELLPQLYDELWPTTRASWSTSAFMSPVEYCIMSQVPPVYRVLAINANDIVWNALVSFFAHRQRRADAERRLLEAHNASCSSSSAPGAAAATKRKLKVA